MKTWMYKKHKSTTQSVKAVFNRRHMEEKAPLLKSSVLCRVLGEQNKTKKRKRKRKTQLEHLHRRQCWHSSVGFQHSVKKKFCSQVQHQFSSYYSQEVGVTDFSALSAERGCQSLLRWILKRVALIGWDVWVRGGREKEGRGGGMMPALVFLWFTWARNDGWIRALRLRLPANLKRNLRRRARYSVQHYLLDKRIS